MYEQLYLPSWSNPTGPRNSPVYLVDVVCEEFENFLCAFLAGPQHRRNGEAYKSIKFESLRDMYLEREHLFSVSRPADLEEIERKVRKELEERNKELQDMLREIRASNRELRIENKELNMRISKMELAMTDFEKKINEIRELLPRRTKDEQSN